MSNLRILSSLLEQHIIRVREGEAVVGRAKLLLSREPRETINPGCGSAGASPSRRVTRDAQAFHRQTRHT